MGRSTVTPSGSPKHGCALAARPWFQGYETSASQVFDGLASETRYQGQNAMRAGVAMRHAARDEVRLTVC